MKSELKLDTSFPYDFPAQNWTPEAQLSGAPPSTQQLLWDARDPSSNSRAFVTLDKLLRYTYHNISLHRLLRYAYLWVVSFARVPFDKRVTDPYAYQITDKHTHVSGTSLSVLTPGSIIY